MSNYDYRTGSRRPHKYDDSTPELQWLEDSANMLINMFFACVFSLLRVGVFVVCSIFRGLFGSRK